MEEAGTCGTLLGEGREKVLSFYICSIALEKFSDVEQENKLLQYCLACVQNVFAPMRNTGETTK